MSPRTKYIYDLPYCEREHLCRILDLHEKWKTLGGLMKFSTLDIQCMEHLERRNKSPSDDLLTKWSLQNHTVQELFVLLYQMKHFQAMAILKPFVDPQYHRLMSEGEESVTKLIADANNFAPVQSPVNCAGPSVSSAGAAAAGHNLNLTLPETQKLNKPGYTDKIQNIGSPVSVEENNSPQPETPPTPGTARSPPMLAPNGNRHGDQGQPQLSPAGIAALSVGPTANGVASNFPGPHQYFDLRAGFSSQRKLSDGSMVTLPSEYQSVLPTLDYKDLEAATNGWNPSNIVGRGGFGTVFKGVWKNTNVAIKRLELPKGDSRESQEIPFQQSLRELQILQSIRHDNIVQLMSVCFNGNQPCLVYQFMERGSLEDRLQCRKGTPPLTWHQRYNIAKGSARGLQYLHTVLTNPPKPLIHGDIKSANILLDSNYEPRIGDFGLAREGPQQTRYSHMKVSKVHGTRPYLPDEFIRYKKLSTKVDTYSFGVVLFELATGLRAFCDKRENKYLKDEVVKHPDVMQLSDPKIGKDLRIFFHFINLGIKCVNKNPKERPGMDIVCQTLDQFALTAAQATPRELQEEYDRVQEGRRLSLSNNPQPGSGQPALSVNRHPASHPPNCLPNSGQPSVGFSANTPPFVGSQGLAQMDNSANAQFVQIRHISNVAISGCPSGLNHTAASPKTVDGLSSQMAGTSIAEPLLPTILPPVHNATLIAISVMPPTESISTKSSLSEYSEGQSQHASFVIPSEVENASEEQAPGNLPLLTILGIPSSSETPAPNDTSEVPVDPELEQSSQNYPVFLNSLKSS